MSVAVRDEFLSEEDLNLRTLTPEERDRVWDAWMRQAQSTNPLDQNLYTHGVFTHEPPWLPQDREAQAGPDIGKRQPGGETALHREPPAEP